MVLGIFKMAFHLRDGHVFMWQSLKILNDFNNLTLKYIFWKTQTLFKKLEYHDLVEITKIDNITFPYKTALSEVMLRQIEWGVQNGPITRTRVLPVTTFLFPKFCFHLGTLYIELIWHTNHPNVHIHTFWNCWSFNLGCFFPMIILKIDLNVAEIRTVQDYICTKN